MKSEIELKKENILYIALDELQQVGVEGTTIDSIASRAGISKKTIYHLFSSKEYILEKALRLEVDVVMDDLETISGIPMSKMDQLDCSLRLISRRVFEGGGKFNQQLLAHQTLKYEVGQAVNRVAFFLSTTYASHNRDQCEMIIRSFIKFLLKCASNHFETISEKDFNGEVIPFYLFGWFEGDTEISRL
ncbi:TetR/AcrR family transcriptional regulator [Fulvivirga sp. M361]|uniref:TetR/AcrR family transcriptional regulator n=1 Tax=Fulvivirga sp. M361 TaxID=2594266 RepID=UPI00117A084A|nr:TetR/AcrR family transcriptional regulator [Fulvivirga sp. M361]TRX62543.1 TetR/AcrR family transcriptional regulator [Fulvivirga sp. M361]